MGTRHDYTGLWVTEDGEIRQALLPNGRYIEARGHLDVAYQGNYQIVGNHIEYQDDPALSPTATSSPASCITPAW